MPAARPSLRILPPHLPARPAAPGGTHPPPRAAPCPPGSPAPSGRGDGGRHRGPCFCVLPPLSHAFPVGGWGGPPPLKLTPCAPLALSEWCAVPVRSFARTAFRSGAGPLGRAPAASCGLWGDAGPASRGAGFLPPQLERGPGPVTQHGEAAGCGKPEWWCPGPGSRAPCLAPGGAASLARPVWPGNGRGARPPECWAPRPARARGAALMTGPPAGTVFVRELLAQDRLLRKMQRFCRERAPAFPPGPGS